MRENRGFGSFKAILRKGVQEMERALEIFLCVILAGMAIGLVAATIVFILSIVG